MGSKPKDPRQSNAPAVVSPSGRPLSLAPEGLTEEIDEAWGDEEAGTGGDTKPPGVTGSVPGSASPAPSVAPPGLRSLSLGADGTRSSRITGHGSGRPSASAGDPASSLDVPSGSTGLQGTGEPRSSGAAIGPARTVNLGPDDKPEAAIERLPVHAPGEADSGVGQGSREAPDSEPLGGEAIPTEADRADVLPGLAADGAAPQDEPPLSRRSGAGVQTSGGGAGASVGAESGELTTDAVEAASQAEEVQREAASAELPAGTEPATETRTAGGKPSRKSAVWLLVVAAGLGLAFWMTMRQEEPGSAPTGEPAPTGEATAPGSEKTGTARESERNTPVKDEKTGNGAVTADPVPDATRAGAAGSEESSAPSEAEEAASDTKRVELIVEPLDTRVGHRGKAVKRPYVFDLPEGGKVVLELVREGYVTRRVVLDGTEATVRIGMRLDRTTPKQDIAPQTSGQSDVRTGAAPDPTARATSATAPTPPPDAGTTE